MSALAVCARGGRSDSDVSIGGPRTAPAAFLLQEGIWLHFGALCRGRIWPYSGEVPVSAC